MGRRRLFAVATIALAVCVGIGLYIHSLGASTSWEPLDYADVKKVLWQAYPSELLPFQIPQEEEDLIESANADPNRKSSTYGEITIGGADQLLETLGLTAKDVFYDLGSGRGQLVLHAALATPVRKSIGIELSRMRHDEAVRAFERLVENHALAPKRVELRLADILQNDWSDATAIYFASALFPKNGVKKVTEKVLRIPRSVKIVSLKRLPQHDRLRFDQTLMVGATWYPAVAAHLYHTIPLGAPVPLAPQAPRVLDPREVAYLLGDIYWGISGAFPLSKQDQTAFQRAGSSPFYGEISPEGARMVFKELGLQESDVLVDLGSGIGKFALQAYLETPSRKVVGIELAETRHKFALVARKKLFSDKKGYIDPQPNRVLELRHGNFLNSDLSGATMLYACSAHYPAKVLQGIVRKALRIPRSVTLVVFNELPKHKRLRKVKQLLVPTSWNDAVPLYIYRTVAP